MLHVIAIHYFQLSFSQFIDVEAEVRAFSKADFKVISQGKHIGMSDGTKRITVPVPPGYVKLYEECRKSVETAVNAVTVPFLPQ